jgi:hypothetical protein
MTNLQKCGRVNLSPESPVSNINHRRCEMRKFVSVFVLLALLLGVSTSAVMAQEPPPDLSDPEAVGALVERLAEAGDKAEGLWTRLSPKEQAAVKKYLKPAYAKNTVEKMDGARGGSTYTLGTTMYTVG